MAGHPSLPPGSRPLSRLHSSLPPSLLARHVSMQFMVRGCHGGRSVRAPVPLALPPGSQCGSDWRPGRQPVPGVYRSGYLEKWACTRSL